VEVLDELQGLQDVVARLRGIAEHDEEPDFDARLFRPTDGTADLLDFRALVHGVEDVLCTRFGAVPDPERPRGAKTAEHLLVDEVDAREARERRRRVARGDLVDPAPYPLLVDREDV